MTHFSTDSVLARTTPTEWLSVGATVGRLVNEWSGRSDLVAYIGAEASIKTGAPARFLPKSGEVEINTSIAFPGATPEDVGDISQRSQQFEFPQGVGAIMHEALHARFSTFSLPEMQDVLSKNEFTALLQLEEARIEGLGVRVMPRNKAFLRACAMKISIGDIDELPPAALSSVRGIAKLLLLTYARVTAGVLTADDIKPLKDIFDMIAPEGLIDELRPLWADFQLRTPERHLSEMYKIAQEWETILAKYSTEAGEDDTESESEEGSGELARQIMEALDEVAENAEFGAVGEAMEQQANEASDESMRASKSKAEKRKESRDVAKKVFSHASGPTGVSGTNSRLVDVRVPTGAERASAVRIAQALERARYRDRERRQSASATPPGRLRTRSVVQGMAMRAQGMMDSTSPWNRIQRKQVDDPTLTIGVMVDISGSMHSAMEPMASAAWVLSEATRRVQGNTAMVYYGSDVFPTLKPGQHLDQVTTYSASDSTEEFGKAFQALDGLLELLNGSGARLLVIVSDGQYRQDQRREARRVIERCDASGVGVLWIGAGDYSSRFAQEYCTTPSSSFVRMSESITDVADSVGEQAAKALTSAGRRA